MTDLSKTIIAIGVVLILIGCLLPFMNKISWLGKLPGDIYIKKENSSFYFPFMTCLLLSLLISLILYFFRQK